MSRWFRVWLLARMGCVDGTFPANPCEARAPYGNSALAPGQITSRGRNQVLMVSIDDRIFVCTHIYCEISISLSGYNYCKDPSSPCYLVTQLSHGAVINHT
ncbi:hypothetical protein EDB89DRAFT_1940656 [Lactarius sanguifluus]|nr:hypothetical protein EDB89DRAFT_1940656 [Lactarius sanguifluus]